MILKKPYAFLIKHFRIIHVILTFFIGFVVKKHSIVVAFLRDNAQHGITSYSVNPAKLITLPTYLLIVGIIIFSISMFILMNQKKKPTAFYIQTFIYYFIFIIWLVVVNNLLRTLNDVSLSNQAARVYKDIALIVSLPQYYFLIFSLIRGIGFDIKKFNFSKDLEELEIKSEDNEEFEFVLGISGSKYKRILRKKIREMKYYIVENKVIITIVSLCITVPLIIYFILNVSFFNKNYKQGQTLKINNIEYTLNKAYITDKDLNGNIVNKNKKYIILDVSIKNNSAIDKEIKDIDFFITTNKESFYHNPSLRKSFLDLGKSYNNEIIKPNSVYDFIFIFALDKNFNTKKTTLNIFKEKALKKDNYIYSKYKFNLDNLSNSILEIEKKKNEEILLGGKLFGKTNIVIKDIKIVQNYEYKYSECINKKCSEYTGIINPSIPSIQNLLVIEYSSTLNKENYLNEEDIFTNYLKVTYKIKDKQMINKIEPKFKNSIKNKVFVEIPKTINNSNELKVHIMTREIHSTINY